MRETETELDQYAKEAESVDYAVLAKATDLKHGKTLLALPHADKAKLVSDVVDRLQTVIPTLPPKYNSADPIWRSSTLLVTLLGALLRSKFDFDADLIERFLKLATAQRRLFDSTRSIVPIIRAVEQYAEGHELSKSIRESLETLRKQQDDQYPSADVRKLVERIAALIAGPSAAQKPLIEPGELWSERALADIGAMKEPARKAWTDLFDHCRNGSGSKPSNAWCKKARAMIESIGTKEFGTRVRTWFELVGRPGEVREMMTNMGMITDATLICEKNADVLKGLAWAVGATGDGSMAGVLGDLAEAGFKKIPRLGARCPRVAGASLVALNLLPGQEPVGEMTRLRARVKQPSARAAVERAINRSAAALGVTAEDVEEMSTPTYGLGADGTLSRVLGSFTAVLAVVGTKEVSLTWRGAGGKVVKSTPAEVKRDHTDALKALVRTQKDLEKMLPAHAHRLERMLVDRRQWPVSVWRQRYLDHAVLGQLSRRLIWDFMDGKPRLAVFHDGRFESSDGSPFEPEEGGQVRLWHPIDSTPEEVLAWRRWLESHEVTQPFKQAHREVYLLTDAERQTATYSNRFAGHVLRQHQFHALCQARGWQYRLMGGFDGYNRPTLDLPRHDMRVEFWVEQPANDQMSEMGINLHILTDQVRFCRRTEEHPMPLEQVDRLVFTEIMRDVDLFVGVASVGNDPTWQDGGPEGRFRTYWQGYSFGELSESAKTRRAVLESLLPRLTKIRDRCSLSERFLVVRGDLRTYKIHLGSGNILMAPNDQYLCIVPSRGKEEGGGVFLPFEGDATLSIILSKAFLLAEDKKIKDETITRQIGGG